MKRSRKNKMLGRIHKHILTFAIVCLSATTLYAQACDDVAFYDSLGQSESGGCGATQYDCLGPVITSGMHKGDRPLGKYQFMPKTLASMGISEADFVGNPAAQEAAIQQFVAMNDRCLQKQGAYDHIGKVVDGVTITKSGLLGAAHLGGCGGAAKWAKGGGGPSDQLGTSLADYAAKFGGYGVLGASADPACGTGVANAASQFAQSQAQGLHNLLACDPKVLEQGRTKIEALKQVNAEIAKAVIQPPTPVEQMTCIDQTAKKLDASGILHANPFGSLSESVNILEDGTLGGTLPKFDAILTDNITNSMNSLSGIPGAISTEVSGLWNEISTAFPDPSGLAASLTGATGGPASGTCGVMEDTWLLNQCINVPALPSLTDIMNNKLGEITGAIASVPDRLIGQVCSVANSQLSGITDRVNSIDNVFEDALDQSLSPITDRINAVDDATTNATTNAASIFN